MPVTTLQALHDCIAAAQRRFAELLSCSLAERPPSREQYVRYLSFQYHLTRDVQVSFLAAAGHRDMARRRNLREFLYRFANEEELHYLVAAKDLAAFGTAPLPINIDVELWHAYFRSVMHERPFVRLGAAAVVENIAAGPAGEWLRKALRGDFLDRANTRFITLHQNETLPHGPRILGELARADLKPRHIADLLEGARKATVLYLRMAEWALRPDAVSRICDASAAAIGAREARRIAEFDVHELEVA
jgi:hypothetical protein